MHQAVYDFVETVARRHGLDVAPVRVLDIGGSKVTTSRYYSGPSVFEVFKGHEEYLVMDIRPVGDVDIVGDATRPWTIPDLENYFDVVVCTEVLEHVKDWVQVLVTAYEVLHEGGRLILTCAGPGRLPHPGTSEDMVPPPGEFYANVAHSELAKALVHVGFRDILTQQVNQDTQATAVK